MKIQTSKEPGRERDVIINRKIKSFPRVWMAWYQDPDEEWLPCGIYTGFDERAAVDYAKDDYALEDYPTERRWQAVEIKLPNPATIIRKQLKQPELLIDAEFDESEVQPDEPASERP